MGGSESTCPTTGYNLGLAKENPPARWHFCLSITSLDAPTPFLSSSVLSRDSSTSTTVNRSLEPKLICCLDSADPFSLRSSLSAFVSWSRVPSANLSLEREAYECPSIALVAPAGYACDFSRSHRVASVANSPLELPCRASADFLCVFGVPVDPRCQLPLVPLTSDGEVDRPALDGYLAARCTTRLSIWLYLLEAM